MCYLMCRHVHLCRQVKRLSLISPNYKRFLLQGFLRSLRSLNDHFGNIYVNLGSPFSVKEYLQHYQSSTDEMLKPMDLQQLTPHQFTQVQDLANHVVKLQQENTVATISNLLALVLMQSVMLNRPLAFEEVIKEVDWIIQVLKNLGASVFENDVTSSVDRILVVHGKMMKLDRERKLRLISSSQMEVSEDVKLKMKGNFFVISYL